MASHSICCICRKQFQNEKFLEIHMQRHKQRQYVKCTVCHKLFTEEKYLRLHMRNHSTGKDEAFTVDNNNLMVKTEVIDDEEDTRSSDTKRILSHSIEGDPAGASTVDNIKREVDNIKSEYNITTVANINTQVKEIHNDARSFCENESECPDVKVSAVNSQRIKEEDNVIVIEPKERECGIQSKTQIKKEQNWITRNKPNILKRKKKFSMEPNIESDTRKNWIPSNKEKVVKCENQRSSMEMDFESNKEEKVCNLQLLVEKDLISGGGNPGRQDKYYKCSICKLIFVDLQDWCIHFRKHTERHTCVDCKIDFALQNLLSLRQQLRNDSPPYVCPRCNQVALTREKFEVHVMLCHEMILRCFMCTQKQHEAKGSASYITPVIRNNRKYSQKVYFGDQKPKSEEYECRKKEKERMLTENVINRDIRMLEELKRMKANAVEGKDQGDCVVDNKTLPICDEGDPKLGEEKTSKIISQINKKMQKEKKFNTVHVKDKPSESEKYICKVCDKVFYNKESFGGHMSFHGKESICKYCGLVFCNSALSGHLELCHSRYACTGCNQVFESKVSLNTHIVNCQCDNVAEDNFVRHMSSHDSWDSSSASPDLLSSPSPPVTRPIKKYRCKICYASFDERERLEIHMKSHEKWYKCGLCSNRFPNLDDFLLHLKKHGLTAI